MREFLIKLFGEHPANDVTGISIFSWTHIAYLVLIFASAAALIIVYFKRDLNKKSKVLDIIGILIAISYFSDFFFQPFWHNGTFEKNGELVLDKFPFHICTVLCPLILYVRFSKHGQKIKTPVAMLACLAPFMWLVYPGSALNTDEAFYSYEIMQLFVYHGLVFIYGIVSLVLLETSIDIKYSYREAIMVVAIALWATLGNSIYSCENHNYNWFFLKNPIFDFVPESINGFVVVIVMYLSCLFIYGVYYLIMYLINKKKNATLKEAICK